MKFYFIYKALAHPELANGHVQPFTLEERLTHARQARTQLGASIPWLVDAMDNRLKHALGNRPNSEFILDPGGKIVRKRAWSDPGQVRKDLETLVGKVDKITREEDVHLKPGKLPRVNAARGVLPRVQRDRMEPLVLQPQIDPRGEPFYAKLRPEAEATVVTTGSGKLYLGFHLDPFHQAHWNNLTPPLQVKLDGGGKVKVSKTELGAPRVKAISDVDPREFLVEVKEWPADEPLRVTVSYSACVGEKACYAVRQSYVLYRRRDLDGGRARGEGAGYWEAEAFARQMLNRARSTNGKISKAEVQGLIRPHFERLDLNRDGYLDRDELKQVADWLNKHHQPGRPSRDPR